MYVQPNAAFCLALLGTLLVYVEFVRPGRVIPGVTGFVVLVYASYCLWQHGPATTGILAVALAAILYVTDAIADIRSIPGIIATVLLVFGARRLFADDPRISVPFGVAGSVLFGAVTIVLASLARRARRNKRSDLAQGSPLR